MSLKSKEFRFFWVVLFAFIITEVFIDNGLTAAEQSSNSTVTIKLKVLSESMDADDITKVRKLIEAGADVNVINKYGKTPLLMASRNGHTEVVKLLLQAKADVNAKDRIGSTALRNASNSGHLDIVQVLLEKGADVNAKDKKGSTALIDASNQGHNDIVEALLAKGAKGYSEVRREYFEVRREYFDSDGKLTNELIRTDGESTLRIQSGY